MNIWLPTTHPSAYLPPQGRSGRLCTWGAGEESLGASRQPRTAPQLLLLPDVPGTTMQEVGGGADLQRTAVSLMAGAKSEQSRRQKSPCIPPLPPCPESYQNSILMQDCREERKTTLPQPHFFPGARRRETVCVSSQTYPGPSFLPHSHKRITAFQLLGAAGIGAPGKPPWLLSPKRFLPLWTKRRCLLKVPRLNPHGRNGEERGRERNEWDRLGAKGFLTTGQDKTRQEGPCPRGI